MALVVDATNASIPRLFQLSRMSPGSKERSKSASLLLSRLISTGVKEFTTCMHKTQVFNERSVAA